MIRSRTKIKRRRLKERKDAGNTHPVRIEAQTFRGYSPSSFVGGYVSGCIEIVRDRDRCSGNHNPDAMLAANPDAMLAANQYIYEV
jgi:hypothetical protein